MQRYQDEIWCEKNRIRVDVNNMMRTRLGARGIDEAELDGMQPQLSAAAETMKTKRYSMAWRELPYMQQSIIEDMEKTAAQINERFDAFVVLGIGGSALGTIAVQTALTHLRYNELPKSKRRGAKVYIEDNVDPERMAALLDVVDVEHTMFNVITKSGGTSETMAQFLIVVNLLREKLGVGFSSHLIATTDAVRGSLLALAKRYGLKTFYVPEGVGGRFSVLSPVGLLPAAVCGADIRELLAGGMYMDKLCSGDDVWKNPAYLLATLQYIAMRRGMNISVMMPYADSLKYMADWYAQLWAESLGKRYDKNGKSVYTGQTPVKALGVTDQHSQAQLYTQGPFDKVVTLLAVENYRETVHIPKGVTGMDSVDFLGGHTLNELITVEQGAMAYALLKSGRMNYSIVLPQVNPFTVGQLFYLLEVETAFAGELLNIDAFDQPGVEEGKNSAYALLGRPGYEAKRAELERLPEKKEKYIL